MKKILVLSCLFFLTTLSITAQEWLTDFEEAEKIANEKNRNIVLVFQGSDWCAPCIKLEKEIWSTTEFIEYSKKHFVMLKADFPRKKKNELDNLRQEKNIQLMEKYNKQGYFPFVAVLDKSGNVLGNTGYKKMSPSEYIKLLSSF
jgi:thioredoxin-related protein